MFAKPNCLIVKHKLKFSATKKYLKNKNVIKQMCNKTMKITQIYVIINKAQ